MTAAQWGTLIPAILAFLGAAGAWLRAQSAHKRIDSLPPPAAPPSNVTIVPPAQNQVAP